jgi:hypothetical protein
VADKHALRKDIRFSNVPGKPRVLFPYIGGVGAYRTVCNEVRARGYLGFTLGGTHGSQCHDGVIRRVMPDVGMVLEVTASLKLPPIESMTAPQSTGLTLFSNGCAPICT